MIIYCSLNVIFWSFRGLHFGHKILLSERFGSTPASKGLRLGSRIKTVDYKGCVFHWVYPQFILTSPEWTYVTNLWHSTLSLVVSHVFVRQCIQLVWCRERCADFYLICIYSSFQGAEKHLLLLIPWKKNFFTTIDFDVLSYYQVVKLKMNGNEIS